MGESTQKTQICLILAPLTHHLAETLPIWRRLAAPVAEDVARAFATSEGLSAHTPLTHGKRSLGRNPWPSRNTTDVQTALAPSPVVLVVKRCMLCGIELARSSRRKVCHGCLPTAEALRTQKLRAAGQQALLRMRRSDDDPAQTQAAKEKRIATSKERMLAVRAWERKHGKVHNWNRYDAEVVPVLSVLTVPEIASLTGLSRHYCWHVREGKKRLHPMHWNRVREFGQVESTADPTGYVMYQGSCAYVDRYADMAR